MELKKSFILVSIFFCHKIAAQTPAWTLQPSICVAQKTGDVCNLLLNIETKHLPTESLCLFLNGQILRCAHQGIFPKEINVAIRSQAIIELKDKQQKTLLSKTLKIKYLESQTLRRRVRPPWSLF
jgi:hypothetical protein